MSTVATRRPAPGSGEVRAAKLPIRGMTCASCAARIERRLSRLGDVAATVNFATQTARVRFPAAVDAADLIAAIEQAGYTATLAAAADGAPAGAAAAAAAGVADPGDPGGGAGHGPGVAVPQLAMGQPGARLAGRALGSLVVPPRGRAGRPARRGDDGHADLGRGRRCARCCRWGPGTSPCCAAAARSACRWRSSRLGRSSWYGRGRRSPPTGLSFAAVRRWTPRC